MSDEIEIALQVGSDKFDDANNEAWRGQVKTLLNTELKEYRPRKIEKAIPGQRGGAAEIIIALGSAGAFTALVTTIKAWINKDKTRKVDLVIKTPGGGSATFTAGDIDDSTLKSIVEDLTAHTKKK